MANKVDCSILKEDQEDYQIQCTPVENADYYIDLTKGITNNNNSISLNMTQGYNKVPITGYTNSTIYKRIYKKSSSGLTGGAIAGIVIACVVAILAITAIALLTRKPSVPINPNSSSEVGISSQDNLEQNVNY